MNGSWLFSSLSNVNLMDLFCWWRCSSSALTAFLLRMENTSSTNRSHSLGALLKLLSAFCSSSATKGWLRTETLVIPSGGHLLVYSVFRKIGMLLLSSIGRVDSLCGLPWVSCVPLSFYPAVKSFFSRRWLGPVEHLWTPLMPSFLKINRPFLE